MYFLGLKIMHASHFHFIILVVTFSNMVWSIWKKMDIIFLCSVIETVFPRRVFYHPNIVLLL